MDEEKADIEMQDEQPMSSMQTALLPGSKRRWNDPPPLGNPASGSRLNRYRRVVDPSLSAAGGSPAPYAASPQQGLPPMGAPQEFPEMWEQIQGLQGGDEPNTKKARVLEEDLEDLSLTGETSWSMPGVVPDFSKGSYYDPENFKVPTITPGNISMSPTLIFKYMIGATHRLVRAGLLKEAKEVQMEIKDMENELVLAGAAFVENFNLVANYINVENYVEAEKKLNEVIGKFAEQSLVGDGLTKNWICWIRCLIHLLKRNGRN